MSWLDHLIARASARTPDVTLYRYTVDTKAKLLRWHILPRNRFFNIYLHKITASDEETMLHDHVACNISWIMRGGYDEVLSSPGATRITKRRYAGQILFRWGSTAHQLHMLDGAPETWTIFLKGPNYRQWGYWCPQGWKPWFEFLKGGYGTKEAGCD